jgi:hypothetical protein
MVTENNGQSSYMLNAFPMFMFLAFSLRASHVIHNESVAVFHLLLPSRAHFQPVGGSLREFDRED